jgi:hypothetical protein
MCRPAAKAAAKINRALDLSEAQSYDACMRDEDSARGELEKNWTSYAALARERCVMETKENATPSYVEALVCIRLTQDPSNKVNVDKFRKERE